MPYLGAPSPVSPPMMSAPVPPIREEGDGPPVRGPPNLAEDLLEGAQAIAIFMYGDPSAVRQVYRLSSEVSPQFRAPFFKLGGGSLCARRSRLIRWIEDQENQAGSAA
jgi:hypothetical protein